MRVSPLVAFSLFAIAATAQTNPGAAPPPATPKIAWETDFDRAMQRAKEEHKPVFVAFLMDDEPANDETIAKHYTDKRIVELSGKFVCLACCIGQHEEKDGSCTKFPGTTCAQHQAIEKKARARWLTGEDVCTPQHVFCDTAGNVVARKVYLIPKDGLEKCMVHTLDAVTKDPDARAVVAAERARVDKWLKDIESRNVEVREAAMRELVLTEDNRAIPAILRIAKAGSDETLRVGAINSLARKGNVPAVRPLAGLLGDGKAQILIAVARALETIQLPDATADLLASLKKEKRDRVRGFLLRAAARSSPTNAAVREACLKALAGASAQLEPCVLLALGRLSPHSTIVAAVRSRLSDKNQNIRGLSIWVLGAQALPECTDPLQELLRTEKTPEVVKIATSALSKCRREKVENYDNLFTTFFSDSDYQ